MEETVFHHLFDIIIDQLDPDLFQIVSACQKFLFIIDRRPMLAKFQIASGGEFANDRMMLS